MQSNLAALLSAEEGGRWREHILYTVKYRLLYVHIRETHRCHSLRFNTCTRF